MPGRDPSQLLCSHLLLLLLLLLLLQGRLVCALQNVAAPAQLKLQHLHRKRRP